MDHDHPSYQPLYQKAGWMQNEKSKEKAMKRSNWYKGDGKYKLNRVKDGKVKKSFQKAGKKQNKKRTAATVIFVPSPKGSLLLKSLKEDEGRMSEITGFKIKYQEAGGSFLTNFFWKDLGKGMWQTSLPTLQWGFCS